MSRAVLLDLAVDAVSDMCGKHGISISVIEPLASGGTRVVLTTADGAEDLRRRAKGKLLTGTVKRSAEFHSRPPIPYL